jgi:hypothetical protein
MLVEKILDALGNSNQGFVCRELSALIRSGRLIFVSEPAWVASDEGLDKIIARISARKAVSEENLPELIGAEHLIEALKENDSKAIASVTIKGEDRQFLAYFDSDFRFIGAFLTFCRNFEEKSMKQQLIDQKVNGRIYSGNWFLNNRDLFEYGKS